MNGSGVVASSLLLFSCASGVSDMSQRIDSAMREYSGDVPGASVLVMRSGNTLVERSWGLANLEQHVPATPATSYRLASVTKQFTAASILLLVEDGELGLDDSIRKALPSLPEVTAPITIRHLLTHTSGLHDYEDLIPETVTEQVRDADVLELLESQNTLYFEPGSRYRYSNSGYALLALIIECASGTPFSAFLQERIFEPLEMTGTVAYEKGISSVPQRAYGYRRTAEGWIRDDQSITSAVLGDGGIYSSIEDLAKWDADLYDDRLLSRESRGLLFTPAVRTDRADVSYGFGWRVTGGSLWHSGETRGFRNVIIRKPEEQTTVVVLTNRNEGDPHALALEILRMLD